jgi:hypothetical protein
MLIAKDKPEEIQQVDVLAEAARAVAGKGTQHGDTRKQMQHTAALWSAYLDFPISAVDVPNLLALLKMSRARIGNPYHPDHYIDGAGYITIAAKLNGVDGT